MSYDLAVWYESEPIKPKLAQLKYVNFCSGVAGQTGNPKVADFVAQLVAVYPQIDDVDEDELDDCPWTNEFDTSDAHCILNIRWGFEEQVAPLVIELANKNGLICYDPQSGIILSD